jgi:hypothetical protein
MAVLGACTNGVVPTGTQLPVADHVLPEGAKVTHWMRLFGSEERLVAYEIRDEEVIVAYCVQLEQGSTRPTVCEETGATGAPTVLEGRTDRGWYIVAIDPQGRIDRFEALSGGCRWAYPGMENGHVSWLDLADAADELALLDADGEAIFGQPLPSDAPQVGDCPAQ